MPDQHQQNPAEIPVVYANSIRVGLNFTELKLFFGETVSQTEEPPKPLGTISQAQQRIVERVCIVLSPDIMPAIAKGLSEAVNLYQSTFGTLRTPPQQPVQPIPMTPKP